MQNLRKFIMAIAATAAILFSSLSLADSVTNSTVGVAGYDLVSYHSLKKPVRGTGNHVATIDGVNYLFASKKNLKTFKRNPDKYLPVYGGFCAYGVAVGKKFIADPDVWEVVDGRLYLNLDNNIKSIWIKDVPGYIVKADKNWKKIEDVPATEL